MTPAVITADEPKTISLYDAACRVVERRSYVQIRDNKISGVDMITEPADLPTEQEQEWLDLDYLKFSESDKKRQGYMILDMVTANAIKTVYEALNEQNRIKLAGFPILKQVNVVWECLK